MHRRSIDCASRLKVIGKKQAASPVALWREECFRKIRYHTGSGHIGTEFAGPRFSRARGQETPAPPLGPERPTQPKMTGRDLLGEGTSSGNQGGVCIGQGSDLIGQANLFLTCLAVRVPDQTIPQAWDAPPSRSKLVAWR